DDMAKIAGQLVNENAKPLPMDVLSHSRGQNAEANHLEQTRSCDSIDTLQVVMLAPEDLALVNGSPQVRRRLIGVALGEIEPMYLYHLAQYQKVLKQRNHLLKQLRHEATDKAFLVVLTDQLIQHALVILKKRFHFLELLKSWAIPIHKQISRGLETFKIAYSSPISVLETDGEETMENKLRNAYQKNEQNEIYRGTTLVGPHCDDLLFFINDKEVKQFGSQGQQRTTALSLKLAEIDLIYDQMNDYPILLLDDVLSELDTFRQSHLLSAIEGRVQTFVTTTSVEGIHHETLKQAQIHTIEDGMIL